MFAKPKMIEIKDEKNNLNIAISETLVTMKDYKEYLSEKNPNKLEDFEEKKMTEMKTNNELNMLK